MFSQDDVDRVQPSIGRLKVELDKAYNVYLVFKNKLINDLGVGKEEAYAIQLLEDIDIQLQLLRDSYINFDPDRTVKYAREARSLMGELIEELQKLHDSYYVKSLKTEIELLKKYSSEQIKPSDPKSLIELIAYRVEQLHVAVRGKNQIAEKVEQLHDNVTKQIKRIDELASDMHQRSEDLKKFAETVRKRIAELASTDIDIEHLKQRAAKFGLDTSEIVNSFTESATARDQVVSALQAIAQAAEKQSKQLIADEAALFSAKGPLLELKDNVSTHLLDLADENTDIRLLSFMQSQFKEMDEVMRKGEYAIHSTLIHNQEVHRHQVDLDLLEKRLQEQETKFSNKLDEHESIKGKQQKTIELVQTISKLNHTCREILDPDLRRKAIIIEEATCQKFDISKLLDDPKLKTIKPDDSAIIDGRRVSILEAVSAATANFDSIMSKLKEKNDTPDIERSPAMQNKHKQENQDLYDQLIKSVEACTTALIENKVKYHKKEKLEALKNLKQYLITQRDKGIDIAKTLETLPQHPYYTESIKHRSIINIFGTESTTKLKLEATIKHINTQLKLQQPKHEQEIPIPVHPPRLRRA